MALRIIRKSSAQSQVELIRGNSDEKAEASLLFFLETEEQVKLAQDMIQKSEWIQTYVQCLFMKGEKLNLQLRTSFSSMGQTIKLLNEPKEASWSLRLRTLIQEADCDICVFLPFVPQADLSEMLSRLVSYMSDDPTLGMLAPSLSNGEQILAAGQACPAEMPLHHLELANESFEYSFEAASLFYLYHNMPLTAWLQFAHEPLQVSGLPLLMSALRKEAYLSLPWADKPWNLPWLAEEVSLALKQQQYRLQVLPQSIALNRSEAFWLDGGSMPETFKDKWGKEFDSHVFKLYHHHGWQQRGMTFCPAERTPQETVASYYAEKVAKAS